jgi:hypothetical protein
MMNEGRIFCNPANEDRFVDSVYLAATALNRLVTLLERVEKLVVDKIAADEARPNPGSNLPPLDRARR